MDQGDVRDSEMETHRMARADMEALIDTSPLRVAAFNTSTGR